MSFGITVAFIKAIVLLLIGFVGTYRRLVLHASIPTLLIVYAIGNGILTLVYLALYDVLAPDNVSTLFTIFFTKRAIFYILIALLFITLLKRETQLSLKAWYTWLVAVAVFSILGAIYHLLPPSILPFFLVDPINFLYYIPRLLLFGAMAWMMPAVLRSKNIILAALSISAVLYLCQDFLKLWETTGNIYAIQLLLDTSAGLVFSLLLFLGLFQHKIELAFYRYSRSKKERTTVSSQSIEAAGFFRFVFTGSIIHFSQGESLEEGSFARRLYEYLMRLNKRNKNLFTYDELIHVFNSEPIEFVRFLRKRHVKPKIIEGRAYYHRDELLRATEAL
jgi:hypothetical protein